MGHITAPPQSCSKRTRCRGAAVRHPPHPHVSSPPIYKGALLTASSNMGLLACLLLGPMPRALVVGPPTVAVRSRVPPHRRSRKRRSRGRRRTRTRRGCNRHCRRRSTGVAAACAAPASRARPDFWRRTGFYQGGGELLVGGLKNGWPQE